MHNLGNLQLGDISPCIVGECESILMVIIRNMIKTREMPRPLALTGITLIHTKTLYDNNVQIKIIQQICN